MGWFLALAAVLTISAVGFALGMTIVVLRDRKRQRLRHAKAVADRPAGADRPAADGPTAADDEAEISEAADCLQAWLDRQWDRRFNRDLNDSSGSIEG